MRRCQLARKGSRSSKSSSKNSDRRAGGRDRDKPDRRGDRKDRRPQRRKFCQFCKDKVDYVDFKDLAALRRFVNDRGRIRARRVTGTCARHQGLVASAVKNAREVALLPYVVR